MAGRSVEVGSHSHAVRTIQRTLWVLESPEVLRGSDIVKSLGMVSDNHGSVPESENGPTLWALPLASWVLFIFPFLLSFAFLSQRFATSFSSLSLFFFFPSLDLSTLLSSWSSAPEVPKSHCEAGTGASILLWDNMAQPGIQGPRLSP